ncbi:CHAD domain-containing protein [Bradyrhizobium sp. U87765 SZCCT0131]|uniref:CYTH and CHAD domain-containing protein n=1 Tax=unclassified Bradyrhizobium TaxID=2631580 RepID=UPI001BAAFED3|nr:MULTISPECIES: CYTH and CHAD domain-containing protein [unclassified Bradyrhizobium]MBR1219244.1 CHAD domain-containing protein [Bradyrhizobium sp. U87765 SZCCT0131]MBR1261895.1 CHAD domain-containing protein [Bradyrhizobium sp. U87765 SZCCT0134]MBR1306252.1 CHAD domain-containing protein [Bradyrhizobium sp. U87765 SZCCT0110]MBR1317677.1 CHAD domain-containing protein [Bradyrhizobium sp. U87765 SZCCT0109]MBR1351379.1 CHAD domain-containing protein [Bradyrhizobium sp. U87765 SZCCT0048]
MGQEIEIKLELPPAHAPRLQQIPQLRRVNGAAETATQVSTYFDTKDFKLRRNGIVLRVRRDGAHHVQTIKAEGAGLIDRREWETELADGTPDLAAAEGTALAPLVTKKLRRQLRPVFETRVRRTTYPLHTRSAEIEVTLDRGHIIAGRQSAPLCEVEIELKRGDDRNGLFRIARSVARATAAELAVKTKSQRGYALLASDEGLAAKAEPIVLAPELPAADAFRTIAASCLRQIVGNKAAVAAGDPDGVHQMRIGLRRLRAAMSLFGALLDTEEADAVKGKLRWLAGELTQAREFEVFLASVVTPVRQLHTRLAGMRSLSDDLVAQHAAAVARASEAVRSDRFRSLCLDVAAFLETGAWRRPADAAGRIAAAQPIAQMAAAELSRRWKAVRKRARTMEKLDPYRRHKLRIQAKKLRYAAEFFETVFPGRKANRRRGIFLAAMRALQDSLGDLNDIAVHETLMAEMASVSKPAKPSARPEAPTRAYAAGLLSGHEDARHATAMAAACAACAALDKAPRFWA